MPHRASQVPRVSPCARGFQFSDGIKSLGTEGEQLPTQHKIDRVNALKEKLERSTIALTTDYTGISVNEMT